MNITALRPKFIKKLEPVARFFAKTGITPNQLTVLSLLCGMLCAVLYADRLFLVGSAVLMLSAVLDLVDGGVARINKKETNFGAVFDWIADKYVDTIVLLGIGVSGIPILSRLGIIPVQWAPTADFAIVTLAIIGSMMNTFIKPVVYAEIGFDGRKDGKIFDPLEGIGFFGRPETLIVLIIGGLTGLIWLSVLVVAVCTNLSAIQRILYLYRTIP
ncbi:MAG TPA: CDP-alcohol phosphatidyltransferase family protein [Methanoculleus sp.]|nr:CDP-alcohol phosphatidyltransferase family protein [Methanoculleus sp.]